MRFVFPIRPRYAPGACDGRSIMAQSVEAVVWDHVKALLADSAVLQAQYEQGRGDPAVDVTAEQERERMERKLTALDREVSRLIDAYQAEVIELSELSERRRGVEAQGRMLRQRLREIEQQRANRENELRLLEGVEAFCASVRGSLEEPAFEVKQKVLQLVVDRVVVEESRVVIQHVVPTGPVRLQTEQLGQKYPFNDVLYKILKVLTLRTTVDSLLFLPCSKNTPGAALPGTDLRLARTRCKIQERPRLAAGGVAKSADIALI